ncbi:MULTISPECIES: Rrf2 family transcriptional regulator [Ensifer]|jgi:DNA-binding IscR family transcriptional regulator|uniref:Transcriptional regulator n=1 Tax=Ensifer canadensis TaxID=555315 RepID=A0AAW4FGE5_9HYPH|nr:MULTISPECIES: Rrf2 family transcriptional regulator [Ensifer]MDP9631083.1 DNA-binding IscR family transcriptional regulator [Ensifer adhaerens]KQU82051.1 Rrf2 family transcriptional regulator [Ensifer sp. Root31]KQW61981.1 Rrf2 family transcriptional regulator [Ensifer sp. Root1252]KQW82088.1 Rrf2 family transcriptional regulator [Ensifer sp. Root127]KRC83134.1 Rrf2 family transcriptional regulator [Ensifer sp. Root231]
MPQDNRLSRMLHVLVHMHLLGGTETSQTIGLMLSTNPVVVRRTMAALKRHGIVGSEGGPGGGWLLTRGAEEISVLDVHKALNDKSVFSLGLAADHAGCPVERAVNAHLSKAFLAAETVLNDEFGKLTLAQIAREFTAAR